MRGTTTMRIAVVALVLAVAAGYLPERDFLKTLAFLLIGLVVARALR